MDAVKRDIHITNIAAAVDSFVIRPSHSRSSGITAADFEPAGGVHFLAIASSRFAGTDSMSNCKACMASSVQPRRACSCRAIRFTRKFGAHSCWIVCL